MTVTYSGVGSTVIVDGRRLSPKEARAAFNSLVATVGDRCVAVLEYARSTGLVLPETVDELTEDDVDRLFCWFEQQSADHVVGREREAIGEVIPLATDLGLLIGQVAIRLAGGVVRWGLPLRPKTYIYYGEASLMGLTDPEFAPGVSPVWWMKRVPLFQQHNGTLQGPEKTRQSLQRVLSQASALAPQRQG